MKPKIDAPLQPNTYLHYAHKQTQLQCKHFLFPCHVNHATTSSLDKED